MRGEVCKLLTCDVDKSLEIAKIISMIGDMAHVCNRGFEKQKIFLNRSYYERFVDNLFLQNNKDGKIRTVKNIYSTKKIPEREKLVEIFKWSLLPNHYHLLLYEVIDGGILEFTKRIGNSFTKYFNIKHEKRSGYLFQDHANIVPIVNDSQFLYIPFYIDINPLDLAFPDRRNIPKHLSQKAIDFLKTYEWSSFKDYYGDGTRLPLINKDLFYETFGNDQESYMTELINLSTCDVDKFDGVITRP